MPTIDLSFPDQSYSSTNKPSVTTLKNDLTLIQNAVNALDDANIASGAGIDGDKIENATDTNRGVASFDEDSFVVTGGDVKPKFLGFNARKSADVAQATNSTIICDAELYDIGANYDSATGIFTAPVDGDYRFDAGVSVAAPNDQKRYGFSLTGSTIGIFVYVYIAVSGTSIFYDSGGKPVHLDVGETVTMKFLHDQGGNETVRGDAANQFETWFTGYLIVKN